MKAHIDGLNLVPIASYASWAMTPNMPRLRSLLCRDRPQSNGQRTNYTAGFQSRYARFWPGAAVRERLLLSNLFDSFGDEVVGQCPCVGGLPKGKMAAWHWSRRTIFISFKTIRLESAFPTDFRQLSDSRRISKLGSVFPTDFICSSQRHRGVSRSPARRAGRVPSRKPRGCANCCDHSLCFGAET